MKNTKIQLVIPFVFKIWKLKCISPPTVKIRGREGEYLVRARILKTTRAKYHLLRNFHCILFYLKAYSGLPTNESLIQSLTHWGFKNQINRPEDDLRFLLYHTIFLSDSGKFEIGGEILFEALLDVCVKLEIWRFNVKIREYCQFYSFIQLIEVDILTKCEKLCRVWSYLNDPV